jgi:hypothetical protein
MYVGRAYMPIVVNSSIVDDILQLNLLYLDVTASIDRDNLPPDEFEQNFPQLARLAVDPGLQNDPNNKVYFCKLNPTCPPIEELRANVKREPDFFFCYPRAYQDHVDKAYEACIDRGLFPWQDHRSIDFGDPWPRTIDEAIKASRAAYVFLGDSLGNTQQYEIDAIYTERSSRPSFHILPVLLPQLRELPAYAPVWIKALQYRTYEQLMSGNEWHLE